MCRGGSFLRRAGAGSLHRDRGCGVMSGVQEPVGLTKGQLSRARRKLATIHDMQELRAFREGLSEQGLLAGPILSDPVRSCPTSPRGWPGFTRRRQAKGVCAMADEWGPWIEHDGAGVALANGVVVEVILAAGIAPPDTCNLNAWPGFYWRLRRVNTGWLSSERRRVCYDPAYAPILRYRIRKSRGFAILERLLADLPAMVDT